MGSTIKILFLTICIVNLYSCELLELKPEEDPSNLQADVNMYEQNFSPRETTFTYPIEIIGLDQNRFSIANIRVNYLSVQIQSKKGLIKTTLENFKISDNELKFTLPNSQSFGERSNILVDRIELSLNLHDIESGLFLLLQLESNEGEYCIQPIPNILKTHETPKVDSEYLETSLLLERKKLTLELHWKPFTRVYLNTAKSFYLSSSSASSSSSNVQIANADLNRLDYLGSSAPYESILNLASNGGYRFYWRKLGPSPAKLKLTPQTYPQIEGQSLTCSHKDLLAQQPYFTKDGIENTLHVGDQIVECTYEITKRKLADYTSQNCPDNACEFFTQLIDEAGHVLVSVSTNIDLPSHLPEDREIVQPIVSHGFPADESLEIQNVAVATLDITGSETNTNLWWIAYDESLDVCPLEGDTFTQTDINTYPEYEDDIYSQTDTETYPDYDDEFDTSVEIEPIVTTTTMPYWETTTTMQNWETSTSTESEYDPYTTTTTMQTRDTSRPGDTNYHDPYLIFN